MNPEYKPESTPVVEGGSENGPTYPGNEVENNGRDDSGEVMVSSDIIQNTIQETLNSHNDSEVQDQNPELSQKNKTKYDSEGFVITSGFNKEGIHRDTGTKYNPEGYDRGGYGEDGFKGVWNKITGTMFDESGYDRDGYGVDGFNREGFTNDGFDRSGINRHTGSQFDNTGHDKDGYDTKGYKEGWNSEYEKVAYNREGYDRYGYDKFDRDRDGYKRSGFNEQGLHKETGTIFDPEGYDASGFDDINVDREGFDREGIGTDGYDRRGFDIEGFNKDGYNSRGYDKFGFNSIGYDRGGFDIEGFNRFGYDKLGYDRDGLDRGGFDHDGINKETNTIYSKKGFNKYGVDKDGFDRSGKDSEGYDREGFKRIDRDHYKKDSEGVVRKYFTSERYNREGYDINGFNKAGFNPEGFNNEGFDKRGFSHEGFDKDGYDKKGLDKFSFNRDGLNQVTGKDRDESGFNIRGINTEGFRRDTGKLDENVALAMKFAEMSADTVSRFARRNDLSESEVRKSIDEACRLVPNLQELIKETREKGQKQILAAITNDAERLTNNDIGTDEFWRNHPKMSMLSLQNLLAPNLISKFEDKTLFEADLKSSQGVEKVVHLFAPSYYDVSGAINNLNQYLKSVKYRNTEGDEEMRKKSNITHRLYDMEKYLKTFQNLNTHSIFATHERFSFDGGQTFKEITEEDVEGAKNALRESKKLITQRTVRDYIKDKFANDNRANAPTFE